MKDIGVHYDAKIIGVDNLFIFLNILGKYDEGKKEVPYCAAWVFFGWGNCDLN